MARAWPRAAQHKIAELSNLQIKKTYQQLVEDLCIIASILKFRSWLVSWSLTVMVTFAGTFSVMTSNAI